MSGKAPDSVNYLKNNGFKFEIPRIPNVNFYIQQANIPSIDVDNIETKTLYGKRELFNKRENFLKKEISL